MVGRTIRALGSSLHVSSAKCRVVFVLRGMVHHGSRRAPLTGEISGFRDDS